MRNEGITVTKGRNPTYKMLWPELIVLARGDGGKESGKRAATSSQFDNKASSAPCHKRLSCSQMTNPPKRVCHGIKMPVMLTFSFCICARRRNPADQGPEGRASPAREVLGEEFRSHQRRSRFRRTLVRLHRDSADEPPAVRHPHRWMY